MIEYSRLAGPGPDRVEIFSDDRALLPSRMIGEIDHWLARDLPAPVLTLWAHGREYAFEWSLWETGRHTVLAGGQSRVFRRAMEVSPAQGCESRGETGLQVLGPEVHPLTGDVIGPSGAAVAVESYQAGPRNGETE